MPGIDYSRFQTPMDGYFEGRQLGQQERANNLNFEQADIRNKAMEAQRQNQILMQAFQLGRYSPERWDEAMDRAVEAGNPEAANFKGKWSPSTARNLIDAYSRASGMQAVPQDANGQVAVPQAAAAGPQQSRSYGQDVDEAIKAMAPEERMQKARQYDTTLQGMNSVRTAEDVPKLIEAFKQRGILDDEHAEAFGQLFDGSENGWRAFDHYYDQIKGLRDHLDNYVVPGGIEPLPEPDQYEQLGFDPDTGQARGIKMPHRGRGGLPQAWHEGGGAGGGPAPPRPIKPEKIIELEQQGRKEFTNNVIQLVDTKRKLEFILDLNPDKATGIEKVAAVYSMVSGLDPGNAVKEGEIALINSAQSMKEQLRGMFAQASEGGKLTPATIRQMQDTSRKLLATIQQVYQMRANAQMKAYSRWVPSGIELSAVVPDLWGPSRALEDPGAPPEGPPSSDPFGTYDPKRDGPVTNMAPGKY